MRYVLCTALLASVVAASGADAAVSGHKPRLHKVAAPTGIGVAVDEARTVTLARPAKTIFVGNPTIADITIIDARHAFILGKSFGTTNLIALDADGHQISNQQVTVINGHQAVTLNIASGQYNFACTHAHCESVPRPGDVSSYFSNAEQAIASQEDTGAKYATGGSAGPAAQQ